eukprot:364487-Chlamydomonas_euryale.AAC.33
MPSVFALACLPASAHLSPQEEDPAAVEELLDASEQTRRRFRDRRFLRTRRVKAAQAAGTPLSQGWFYGVDDWLRGTKADGAEVAPMPEVRPWGSANAQGFQRVGLAAVNSGQQHRDDADALDVIGVHARCCNNRP